MEAGEDEKKDTVGFTAEGWGLSPRAGKKWHDGKEGEFLWAEGHKEIAKWREGEVISVAADLEAGELLYARNGQWVKAFDVAAPDGLCPTITLDWFVYFGINWGEAPFSFPLEGFVPIAQAVPAKAAPTKVAAPSPDASAKEAAQELVKAAVSTLTAALKDSVAEERTLHDLAADEAEWAIAAKAVTFPSHLTHHGKVVDIG